jgi:hypothetical protein
LARLAFINRSSQPDDGKGCFTQRTRLSVDFDSTFASRRLLFSRLIALNQNVLSNCRLLVSNASRKRLLTNVASLRLFVLARSHSHHRLRRSRFDTRNMQKKHQNHLRFANQRQIPLVHGPRSAVMAGRVCRRSPSYVFSSSRRHFRSGKVFTCKLNRKHSLFFRRLCVASALFCERVVGPWSAAAAARFIWSDNRKTSNQNAVTFCLSPHKSFIFVCLLIHHDIIALLLPHFFAPQHASAL